MYLDALENQLKGLLKAMDTMVAQRKQMAEAAGDFSASLHALSTVELSPTLSGPLEALSDLQITIRDVYDRQAQQDVLTFGITLEEYIRLIGSVKQAFGQRQKAFYAWHTAESDLQKRKGNQDKLLRQGKSQQDRLNQVSAEVGDAERKVHQAHLLFEDMGRLLRQELDRFEREKVEDFKAGVETFLESSVEAQKEVRTWNLDGMVVFDANMLHSLSRSGRPSSCKWTLQRTKMSSTSRLSSSQPAASPLATRLSTERAPASTRILTRRLELVGAVLIHIMIAGLFGGGHLGCIWRGISVLEHIEPVYLTQRTRNNNNKKRRRVVALGVQVSSLEGLYIDSCAALLLSFLFLYLNAA